MTTPLDEHHDPAGNESTEDEALEAVDDAWQERLARLAEHVRTALVLRHVVGIGYAEIAEAVGRPVGTVKSDVHRGLESLRRALIEEGVTV